MRLQGHGDADLAKRTKIFALRVVRLYSALPKTTLAQTFGRQLLRSGTSVGAQVAEANFGRSRAEFISKMESALQELHETKYWLDLLAESAIVKPSRLSALEDEAGELTAVMVAIVHNSRRSGSNSH